VNAVLVQPQPFQRDEVVKHTAVNSHQQVVVQKPKTTAKR